MEWIETLSNPTIKVWWSSSYSASFEGWSRGETPQSPNSLASPQGQRLREKLEVKNWELGQDREERTKNSSNQTLRSKPPKSVFSLIRLGNESELTFSAATKGK